MKLTKKLLAVVLAALLVLMLAACGNNTQGQTATTAAGAAPTAADYDGDPINVAGIKGPTGMGMAAMMDNENYNFTLTSDPTEVVSLLVTGKVDIAACPLNLAANLYKKTNGDVQMLAVNTLGVLYLLTNGETVNSISDLAGKTIYATGQGATPEYILRDLLKANKLEDVKVEFLSDHSELAAKLASGDVKIAVLPEPYVTVAADKNSSVSVALSLTELWNDAHPDTRLAQGCVVARKAFIDSNPQAVLAFLSDARASVEYVNINPLAASKLMISHEIVADTLFSVAADTNEKKQAAAESQKANDVISRCNIVLIEGAEMQKIADENFAVLFAADPASVGGALPEAALYYGV